MGREVEALIRDAGGEGVFVQTDVSRPEQNQAFLEAVAERFGPQIDLLFNNAGTEGEIAPFLDQDLENWDYVMAVNARAPFEYAQAAMRRMLEQPGGGVIINHSSIADVRGYPTVPAYVASKFALNGITQSASHVDPSRVRVITISPGHIDAPSLHRFIDSDPDQLAALIEAQVPMGRIGTPEEVARLVMYLASPDGGFFAGSNVIMDGGFTA